MNIKCTNRIIVILISLILLLSINSFGVTTGSFSVTINSKELEVGQSGSVSINTTNCAGQFSISSSNNNVIAVSSSSEWIEGTKNVTITAKKSGSATITITATNVGDNQAKPEDVTGSKTINVTVKEKSPETPTTPVTPTNPTTPTTPTATEPKFTSVNKIVYATGNINLRSSWSTSSSATQVNKDTELTLTGTSSEKINGYIWYRVTYNGQTKYVANSLITETKPEETSNVNLKSLKLSVDGLTPAFKADVTDYTLEVDNTVNDINVTTEAEDSKSEVTVEGNKDLKVGENIIKITVKSEDGKSTKVYNIKVTKKEETLKLGLKSLNIKDTNISTLFKSDMYEYEIDIKDVDTLEIEAIANIEGAKVEILGNSELKEGENIITIMVTSEDGKETITYQIKANKKIEVQGNTKNSVIDTKVIIYASIAGAAFIALVIVIIYTIRNRNVDKEDGYEYNDNLEKENGNNEFIRKEEDEMEKTQEIPEFSEYEIKDEKPEIDYVQNQNKEYNDDNDDDDNRPRRRKGKHF